MKAFSSFILAGLLLCCTYGAAAKTKPPAYSLPTKGLTLLQATPDRAIAPQAQAPRHTAIPGESPTTGLAWQGTYLPMLVQIDNGAVTTKAGGRNIKTSGVDKASPWGVHHADIMYESLLHIPGSTRFTFLFSDCFAKEQPRGGVGPVRSSRILQMLLREEWQAGYVYSGGFGGSYGWRDQQTAELLQQTGAEEKGVLFNLLSGRYVEHKNRVQGVKAPGNYNADILGLRGLIPTAFPSQPRPFLFAEDSPYGSYAPADTIHLDWGSQSTVSHFKYDGTTNTYLRYAGPGVKENRWAPFTSFAAAQDRSEENRQSLSFANVILQRVEYQYVSDTSMILDTTCIGAGNADIFIGGRYISGYWVRPSLWDATVYYDDQGRELQLNRGKTYIALFPPEAQCAYTSQNP